MIFPENRLPTHEMRSLNFSENKNRMSSLSGAVEVPN